MEQENERNSRVVSSLRGQLRSLMQAMRNRNEEDPSNSEDIGQIGLLSRLLSQSRNRTRPEPNNWIYKENCIDEWFWEIHNAEIDQETLQKIFKEFGCLAAYICSRISNDGVLAIDFEVLETPGFIKEFVSSFYKEFFLEKNLEIQDLEKIKQESEVIRLVPSLEEVKLYLKSSHKLSINECVVLKIALDMHLCMAYKLKPQKRIKQLRKIYAFSQALFSQNLSEKESFREFNETYQKCNLKQQSQKFQEFYFTHIALGSRRAQIESFEYHLQLQILAHQNSEK